MAKEQYGFFDSTAGDAREYADADMSRFTRILARSGVRELGSNLKVETASDGLKVKIGYGTALVQGYYYELANDGGGQKIMALETATSNPRIDRLVLRLDLNTSARTVGLRLLKGTEANSPTAPALTRTERIYEISLAQVRVGVGASAITAANITDERADDAVCGVLHRNVIYEKGRQVVSVPATGWTTNAQGWAERTVSVAGLTVEDDVDMAVQGAQIGNVLLAGGRCDTAGTLTIVCLAAPPASFDLLVRVKGVTA